jgi:hypothetical protein
MGGGSKMKAINTREELDKLQARFFWSGQCSCLIPCVCVREQETDYANKDSRETSAAVDRVPTLAGSLCLMPMKGQQIMVGFVQENCSDLDQGQQ